MLELHLKRSSGLLREQRLFGNATLACLLTLVICSQSCFGQTASRSELIAPLLDEQTVAVIRINLKSVLESQELTELLQSLDHLPDNMIRSHLGLNRDFLNSLHSKGCNELYLAVSLSHIIDLEPCLIIPLNNAEDAQKLQKELGDDDNFTDNYPEILVQESTVIAADFNPEEDFFNKRSAERMGFQPALEALSDHPIQLVIAPSASQKRVLRGIAGQLANDFASDDVLSHLNALEWLTMGIGAQNKEVDMVLSTASDEAAQILAANFPKLLNMIVQLNPQSTDADESDSSQVFKLVSDPEVTGSTVRFQIGSSFVQDRIAEATAINEKTIRDNLKYLGLAMHNFLDVYGGFPPPASYDEDKPLLSWRVYLLPFIDHSDLYNQFRRDEPWDSEHNRQFIKRMPKHYQTGHADLDVLGKTTLLLPVDEKTPFHGKTGPVFRELTDGSSNTIMIVNAPHEYATEWTRPSDMEVKWHELKEQFFSGREGFWAVFFDGSARKIPSTIDKETLRRLLMHQDGEVVGEF